MSQLGHNGEKVDETSKVPDPPDQDLDLLDQSSKNEFKAAVEQAAKAKKEWQQAQEVAARHQAAI
eukprot:6702527-Prorocentrum_lima.AAC.1